MKKTNKTKPDAAAEKEIKQSQESETVNNGATSETLDDFAPALDEVEGPDKVDDIFADDSITDVKAR